MSPAVKSALGHVETYSWLAQRCRERIADGTALPDVETVERWAKDHEAKAEEWRRAVQRITAEETPAAPLI